MNTPSDIEVVAYWPIEFAREATAEEGGLDIEALYARNRHWVILGDPGSGKTTLLRHQAWKSANDHSAGRGAVVPVWACDIPPNGCRRRR